AASPPAATRAALEAATLCLLNRERTRRGLRRVGSSPTLTSVARGHATAMVRRKFFAHTTPAGITFLDRVRASGYLRRRPFAVGEVLAWARRGTPVGQVRALMRSPPHREIILTPSFRSVGVGVAIGTPSRVVRRGTVTVANFGRVG
ncbi:MAG: CAP domain-containing protein, partial [Solirubrobacterales bacterium]|nr:CAP domain-containing protein [Solirubrobacterales bacterium]